MKGIAASAWELRLAINPGDSAYLHPLEFKDRSIPVQDQWRRTRKTLAANAHLMWEGSPMTDIRPERPSITERGCDSVSDFGKLAPDMTP